jgi:hypothetical protein
MTIEAQYGVPTVALHTDKFDRVARSVAAVNGMSELRQVFVPQPVMGKTPAELRAYVDGRDPLTGRPVMQEVIEGLTTPFDGRGVGTIEYDRSTPRLVEADTEENLQRLFMERAAGRIICPSCFPPRRGWRRCSPRRAASPTRSSGACARPTSGKRGNTRLRRSR